MKKHAGHLTQQMEGVHRGVEQRNARYHNAFVLYFNRFCPELSSFVIVSGRYPPSVSSSTSLPMP